MGIGAGVEEGWSGDRGRCVCVGVVEVYSSVRLMTVSVWLKYAFTPKTENSHLYTYTQSLQIPDHASSYPHRSIL